MKFSVKPAAGALNSHRYNPFTIASLDFGEAVCVRHIECEKKDNWNSAKVNGFLRMAPMDFPAYGRCYLKSATFFVPYYQLMNSYDAFRNNDLVYKGKPTKMVKISSQDINRCFAVNTGLATQVASETSAANFPAVGSYDFVYVNPGSSTATYLFYTLTSLGKRYYKLLKSLGYDFRSYGYSSGNTGDQIVAFGAFNPNALNILAYLKIYCDYFLNIHFYNNHEFVAFLQAVRDGVDYTTSGGTLMFDSSTGMLHTSFLAWFLSQIYLPHHPNLYTNAWNSQSSPTGVVNENPVLTDGVLSIKLPNAGSVYTADNVTISPSSPYLGNANSNSLKFLTQQGLNTLYGFYQFVKRNNLFGSEAARQGFARFGIKGDDYDSYFVSKIAETSTEIDFSAVMSNSNTENGANGSPLGAYAGVGLGSLNFEYNYKCRDYGVIMTLCWVQIAPLWVHGFDPSVLRSNPFDWYTPEFDGKASRAIPNCEILHGKNPADVGTIANDTMIYGFTDVYDEYRELRDVVLGDFVIGLAQNFMFARDLSQFYGTRQGGFVAIHPQTQLVQYYSRTGNDIDLTDPFQFANTNGDRFYLQLTFDIDASRPVSNKSGALDLNGPGEIEGSTDSVQMS